MQKKTDIYRYFSRQECLKGREIEYPMTAQLEENLKVLLTKLNIIREKYGKPLVITSLYRPGHYNKNAGGAKSSAHLTCEACDFADADGALDAWCLKNVELLKSLGLRLESPDHTKGWCHLDTRLKPGGNVVFKP